MTEMVEIWSTCTAICSSTPSSCVAASFSYPHPLTILAVGSPHVYIIDSRLKKCLAVVRFPRAVVHVSTLYSVKELEMSTVVCCLRDVVMVFNVASTLPSSQQTHQDNNPSISDEDLLDSLFGDNSWEAAAGPSTTTTTTNTPSSATTITSSSTSTGFPARVLDSSAICEGIALCPALSWELVAASVINNNLVMCRKCQATRAISFLLVKSTNRIIITLASREIPIPTFISARPIQSFTVDAGRNVGSDNVESTKCRNLYVKPVFTVVQSTNHPWRCCTSIASKFYMTLFGPEITLAKEPVLVIGMQNGKVYYTNFNCSIDEGHSGVKGGNVLGPLYDMEQPVVGLHWVYFPPDNLVAGAAATTVSWDMDDGDAGEKLDETPNTLICVGHRGKVAVCYYDPVEKRCFRSVTEYQVPGPVLSSALAPKQCLLFTTLRGLYRICLRRDCARCMEEKLPNLTGCACSVKIPHVSFSFPEKVLVPRSVAYILRTREADEYYQADSAIGSDSVQFSYIVADGCMATGELCTHADRYPPGHAGPGSRRQSAGQVGKEIRQCLDSIQATSQRLSKTKCSIESVDRALCKMKDNLALLSAIAGICDKSCDLFPSCAPFTCSFASEQLDHGLRIKKLFVDLTVTYKRPRSGDFPRRLSSGWSFLVRSTSLKDSGFSLTKLLSLSGMVAEDSVSIRTEIGHEELQLPVMMQCFLCYNPQISCDYIAGHSSNNSGPNCLARSGVSLHVCSKMVTVLDFAKHSKQSHNTFDMSLYCFNKKNLHHHLAADASPSSSLVGPSHCITLPISSAAAIRTILACSTASTERDLLKLDKKLLTNKLVRIILSSVCPVVQGKGVARENEVMMYSVIDGPTVSFEVKDNAGNTGGTDGSLLLAVKSCSKQSIVEIVASIHSFLSHHQSVCKSESERVSADSGTDFNPEELSERAEEFKNIAREVCGMREDLSLLQQQVKNNCLPMDAHKQQLKSMKSRVFSAFCKLRELQHV